MGTGRHVVCRIVVLVLAALAPATSKATSVTIFFDNEGPEEGITAPGTTDFSFMGSNWTGGVIERGALPSFGYLTHGGSVPVASVTFDDPVEAVEFLFEFGVGAVVAATAFDADGNFLMHVAGGGGRVTFDPEVPIARIEFLGGFIDDFTFTLVPEPTSGTLVALGATLLAARRVRKRSGLERDSASPEASRRC